MTRRTLAIARLDEHPNRSEVLAVLARLAHVTDTDLPRLAAAWTNDAFLAAARDRALAPDSPLVCEVLSAFDAVSALFADDLRGDADYVTVPPPVVVAALKAVRDALAGAYARPVLSRAEHAALLAPWRAVYGQSDPVDRDLGPQDAQVQALLSALPRLAARCHDPEGQALWDALVDQSFVAESDRAEACSSAFSAAVLTSRRRVWALVRRTGAERLGGSCPSCRTSRPVDRESGRVLALCLDAACALLVADALPDALTDVLTAPVAALVPQQRRPVL